MGEPSHPDQITLVAADLMVVGVATVTPDTTLKEVAKLLLERGLEAAVVVDKAGVPIGMVSEADLLGRQKPGERQAWWLKLLTSADLADRLGDAREQKVQTVMTTPAITVEPFTSVHEIADLLHQHHFSSLPVLDGGKLVGIVSRDDLFGALQDLLRPSEHDEAGVYQFFESLFAGKKRPSPKERLAAAQDAAAKVRAAEPKAAEPASADAFRHLVTASQEGRLGEKAKAAEVADLEAQRRADEMIDAHLSEQAWRDLLEGAKHAAEHSETELLLIQFPAKVCTDGGRALGVQEDGWEKTLRGEPAEVFARWEQELKAKGFGLSARVEAFEDGKVRDYGMVLTWGR